MSDGEEIEGCLADIRELVGENKSPVEDEEQYEILRKADSSHPHGASTEAKFLNDDQESSFIQCRLPKETYGEENGDTSQLWKSGFIDQGN